MQRFCKTRRISPAALGLLCVAFAPAIGAPPSWEHLHPSGAQRGQSVDVEIIGGKFDTWPLATWSDDPQLEVACAEKKGHLRVSVAQAARPGRHWIRLHSTEGGTSLRPFVVGEVPEVVEDREAASRVEGQEIATLPVTVNGRLERNGDIDSYTVRLERGDQLVAALTAYRELGSPMDGILQLVSRSGFEVARNHDVKSLDPILAFEARESGEYTLRVLAFPAQPSSAIRFAGSANYVYRLTLTTGPLVDHAEPMAVTAWSPCTLAATPTARACAWSPRTRTFGRPSQILSQDFPCIRSGDGFAVLAVPGVAGVAYLHIDGRSVVVEPERNTGVGADVACPRIFPALTVSGKLADLGESDAYTFAARKGQKLVLGVRARALGSPLDPVVEVLDPAGKRLVHVDDSDRNRRDVKTTASFREDGDHRIVVRDLHGRGGPAFFYLLSVGDDPHPFRLSVAQNRFSIPADKPLVVPVQVARRDDLDEAIEVFARGLPQGIACEPVISEKGGKTAGEVKLTLHAKGEAWSGPWGIEGRLRGRKGEPIDATSPLEGLTEEQVQPASTRHLWITSAGAK